MWSSRIASSASGYANCASTFCSLIESAATGHCAQLSRAVRQAGVEFPYVFAYIPSSSLSIRLRYIGMCVQNLVFQSIQSIQIALYAEIRMFAAASFANKLSLPDCFG